MLGVLRGACPRVWCRRALRPRGTLAWGTAGWSRSSGLCVGLDVGLLEVVGVELVTCGEVGVAEGVHALLGGARGLAMALEGVEERSAGGSARDKG